MLINDQKKKHSTKNNQTTSSVYSVYKIIKDWNVSCTFFFINFLTFISQITILFLYSKLNQLDDLISPCMMHLIHQMMIDAFLYYWLCTFSFVMIFFLRNEENGKRKIQLFSSFRCVFWCNARSLKYTSIRVGPVPKIEAKK